MKKKALFITIIITACAPFSALNALWNPFKASSYDSVKSGFESVGSSIKDGFEEGFSAKTWAPVGSFFKDTVYKDGLQVAGEKTHEYVYDKGLKVAADKIKNLVVGGWEKIKAVPGQLNKIANVIGALPDTLRASIKPIDAIPDQFTAGLTTLDNSITDIIKTQVNTHKQKNDVKEQLGKLPIQIAELQDLEQVLVQAFDELGLALKELASPASIEQCTALATTNEKKAFASTAQGGADSLCSCQNGSGVMCQMRETLYTARQDATLGIAKIHSSINSVNSIVNKKACIGSLCYPTLPERLHDIAAAIDNVLP